MKSGTVLFVLSLLALQSNATKTDTLGTVIDKLNEMHGQNEVLGKEQEIAYQNYERHQLKTIKTVSAAIAENKDNIESFEDTRDQSQSEMDSLTEGIDTDDVTIDAYTQDSLDSVAARGKAKKTYTTTEGQLTDTIAACKSAVTKLKDTQKGLFLQKGNLQEVTALLEVATFSATTDAQLRTVNRLSEAVAKPSDADGSKAGHVKKVTYHLAEVIALIEELQAQFEAQHRDLVDGETNAENAHTLEEQARADQKTAAEAAKALKTKDHLAAETARDAAKGSLVTERADLSDNQDTLEDTRNDLSGKKSEYNTRTETLTQENAAIKKAVDILSKSAGVRESNYRAPEPVTATSFLQIDDPKQKAIALIRAEAHKVKSQALERLAIMISTHLGNRQTPGTNSPFDAVNNMIEKMIFQLDNEQKEENEHKLWCDKEVKHTRTDKADLEDKILLVKADIKELAAAIVEKADDKQDAIDVLERNQEDMAALHAARKLSKADNKVSLADAKEAQTALSNARAVLTKHYKESGHDVETSFLAAPVVPDEAPATWQEDYTGNEGGKAVVQLLVDIEAAYNLMESETKAAEESEIEEFKKLIADFKVDNAEKSMTIEQLTRQLSDDNAQLSTKRKQLKRNTKEHEDTVQYMVELTGTESGDMANETNTVAEDAKAKDYGACLQNDDAFDARQQARTDEIEALHKAQKILSDAFSQAKRETYAEENDGEGKETEEETVDTGRPQD